MFCSNALSDVPLFLRADPRKLFDRIRLAYQRRRNILCLYWIVSVCAIGFSVRLSQFHRKYTCSSDHPSNLSYVDHTLGREMNTDAGFGVDSVTGAIGVEDAADAGDLYVKYLFVFFPGRRHSLTSFTITGGSS